MSKGCTQHFSFTVSAMLRFPSRGQRQCCMGRPASPPHSRAWGPGPAHWPPCHRPHGSTCLHPLEPTYKPLLACTLEDCPGMCTSSGQGHQWTSPHHLVIHNHTLFTRGEPHPSLPFLRCLPSARVPVEFSIWIVTLLSLLNNSWYLIFIIQIVLWFQSPNWTQTETFSQDNVLSIIF